MSTHATGGTVSPSFPFTALVGQARLQRALLLAAVDPAMGGVLIQGPRGTAKSTSARALAELLPEGHFVTLPLSASEEQLIGTLNLEQVLQNGQVHFAPGLLAKAHLGVLYVDEVNLLPDHLTDQLLDVAASGINIVERDGISHQHPARFVLIGTMNPDEGELRPQLLDRFGLALPLENCYDPTLRQQIVKTRLAFDRDPVAFRQRFAATQQALIQQIQQARHTVADLSWSDAVYQRVSEHCIAAQVDGIRADLVMLRAARTQAALQGDSQVTVAHVDDVAEWVLWHRRRKSVDRQNPPPPPFTKGGSGTNPPLTKGESGMKPPLTKDGAGTNPPLTKKEAGMNPPLTKGESEMNPPFEKGGAGGDSLPGGDSPSESDFGALPPQPVDTLSVGLRPLPPKKC